MIRVANAPCSWGVIENVEGERGGYARVLDEMYGASCPPIRARCGASSTADN